MSDKIERCLTIKDLANKLSMSLERTRQLVMNEPGVLRFTSEAKGGKVPRKTMYRIPESVAERILRRNANPA